MVQTLGCLQQSANRESLLNAMEVFVNEPLLDWQKPAEEKQKLIDSTGTHALHSSSLALPSASASVASALVDAEASASATVMQMSDDESVEHALQRRERELQGGKRRRVAHQRARMILPSA